MAKTRHFGASPKCRRFSLINDSQLPLNPLTERVGLIPKLQVIRLSGGYSTGV